jgi:hypothetical protein
MKPPIKNKAVPCGTAFFRFVYAIMADIVFLCHSLSYNLIGTCGIENNVPTFATGDSVILVHHASPIKRRPKIFSD